MQRSMRKRMRPGLEKARWLETEMGRGSGGEGVLDGVGRGIQS